jgi:uncharacterized protein with FMN-binding domain
VLPATLHAGAAAAVRPPALAVHLDAAEPLLRQEALRAQSAQIDVLSGATYTSDAYAQSLQSALTRARA